MDVKTKFETLIKKEEEELQGAKDLLTKKEEVKQKVGEDIDSIVGNIKDPSEVSRVEDFLQKYLEIGPMYISPSKKKKDKAKTEVANKTDIEFSKTYSELMEEYGGERINHLNTKLNEHLLFKYIELPRYVRNKKTPKKYAINSKEVYNDMQLGSQWNKSEFWQLIKNGVPGLDFHERSRKIYFRQKFFQENIEYHIARVLQLKEKNKEPLEFAAEDINKEQRKPLGKMLGNIFQEMGLKRVRERERFVYSYVQ